MSDSPEIVPAASSRRPTVPVTRPPIEPAAWKVLPLHERLRRNLNRLDEQVLSWDTLCAEPVDPDLAEDDRRQRPLVFLHVPRTGGTTLGVIVSRNFSANLVLHVNAPDLERHPDVLFKLWEPHLRTGRTRRRFAVLGHYKLDNVLYQFPGVPFVHTTLLRDPVRRVISHFKDVRSHDTLSSNVAEGGFQGFEEFLERNERLECWNPQTLRIAGCLNRKELKTVSEPGRMDELFAQACENLERRFSFFGITEDFDAFLLTCHRLLGWRELLYQRHNVLRGGSLDETIPDGLLEQVRANHAWDLRLLDFARELSAQRHARLGIDNAMVQRLRDANRHYQQLLEECFDRSPPGAAEPSP